ncbi:MULTISPECIES: ABC-2 transporter permease [Bacillus cereus group]|uniref:ABC-2 transporter permease n=1 Tax=Bacillus cereus group TaxID=86661 RepID=UPI0007FB425E|nr:MULTISPECIES: ABC-2 transporter permease [Bacillus cereus group]MCP1394819.1 ABC-2 type transport system permease protein [Bacillus cereus]MED3685769.1 ABC-2 transporter permease [Bacillus thuringiensis]OBW87433.1 ABC transporter permease [Bacillus cereus]PER55382.1 ABC-2 transporter permease [Bacillus thuringiensis]PES48041.1 ABC-2 transporter permease [Bacillus thuringiensis]
MRQLIIKDFIMQWKHLIWYLIYPLFLYMTLTDIKSFYVIMSAIIPIIAILKTFNDDKKYDSEVMLNSLPLAKKGIVAAKYIMAIIIFIISMVVSIPVVINRFEGGTFEFITTTVITITGFVFIYLSLVLPISLLLGYKKSIFITLFILMAPIVIVEMFFQINIEQIHLHNGVLLICSICMLLLSVLASVKLYEKREF